MSRIKKSERIYTAGMYVLCIVSGLILSELNVFEKLHVFNQALEHKAFDRLLSIVLVSPIFLFALAWFRSIQLSAEVKTRHKAEKENEWLANHDVLTSLPNRRYLNKFASETVAGHKDNDQQISVFYVDLDRFKAVNDAYGHAVGDGVLIEVANIIREVFADFDFVARISGDEFVGILRDKRTDHDLGRMAAKVLDRINRPMTIDNIVCQIGASIGISKTAKSVLDSTKKFDQLLSNADLAMHKAKQAGRNHYMIFEPQHRTEFLTDSKIRHELEAAVAKREFAMVYQPQFDAVTMEIIGIEALIRWNHPTRGVLTPDNFLPHAEALNLLANIDEIVLQQVIRDIEIWDSLGYSFGKIAVNISQQRLSEPDFLEKIERHKVGENSIAFELMESIFFDGDDDSIKKIVEGIKALGCDVELDDFGTGHASLMSLSMIEPDCMKIDRDLIKPILDSRAQRDMVGKIVEIAKSLNIRIVAEGVETLEQAEILRRMGCDTLQGYAFAKPMPSVELIDFCFADKAAKIA